MYPYVNNIVFSLLIHAERAKMLKIIFNNNNKKNITTILIVLHYSLYYYKKITFLFGLIKIIL